MWRNCRPFSRRTHTMMDVPAFNSLLDITLRKIDRASLLKNMVWREHITFWIEVRDDAIVNRILKRPMLTLQASNEHYQRMENETAFTGAYIREALAGWNSLCAVVAQSVRHQWNEAGDARDLVQLCRVDNDWVDWPATKLGHQVCAQKRGRGFRVWNLSLPSQLPADTRTLEKRGSHLHSCVK